MKVELKKVKFHEDMSDETNCFSADIWVDGKNLAQVQNQGCGGCNMYYPHLGINDPKWIAFEKWSKKQPPHVYEGFTLESNTDRVVDDLFTAWVKAHDEKQANTQIKRWCKTQTVYRLKGDEEGAWRTAKVLYTSSIGEHLHGKFGAKIEEIANERK